MKSKISRFIAMLCLITVFAQSFVFSVIASDAVAHPLLVVSSGCNRVYANGNYSVIDSADDTVRCYVSDGGTYVPLEFVMAAVGGKAENDGTIIALTTPDGETWYVATDRKTIYQKKSKIMNADIKSNYGRIFILSEQLAEILDAQVFYNESVAYFMKNSQSPSAEQIEAIESRLFFETPTEKQIISDLLAKNPDNVHPRVLARKEDFDRIRENLKTDELLKSWYDVQKLTADLSLTRPPYRWELRDGLRLLYVAQDVTARINALALAYQIEKDEKYAKRAYLELKEVCEYPNWVVTHWLDIGQMCQAVAVGYDWLYEWMSEKQREDIKNSIVRLGLKQFEISYNLFDKGENALSDDDKAGTWTRVSTNWNPWCNSGSIMAALAVGIEEPELSSYILSRALQSLEISLYEYAPDGGGTEGLSYGNAATTNFCRIMASLDSALGTDYGYFNVPGFPGFAYYLPYMDGPASALGYGDNGGPTRIYLTGAFYMANKLGDAALGNLHKKDIEEQRVSGDFLDILYYRPELYEGDLELQKDKYFRKVETGTMRSSWDDPGAIWLGFHGGDSSVGHAHLDSGTFALDAMGLNWALDLGTEPLTYTGSGAQIGGDAYLLYRLAAQGHNCLQINLNSERGQVLNSVSPIVDFVSKPSGAYAIMDLSEAYGHVATSAFRGFGLFDSRRTAVVQDEIELEDSSDVWWLMHTPAAIEVSEDGKTAILSQKGKRLRATLVSPANGTFYAMEAEPLPGTPTNEYQMVNTGIHKLAANIPNTSKTTITVQFDTIYDESDFEKPINEVVALDDWKIVETSSKLPTADAIFIDGVEFDDFNPEITHYEVPRVDFGNNIAKVTATSAYDVEIIEPDKPTESKAKIIVKDGVITNTYTISFTMQPFSGLPSQGKRVNVTNVFASEEQVDLTNKNYATNAVDDDMSTRWSADGEVWIQLELSQKSKLGYVSLAFYNGHTRQNYFDIELSEDGETWTRVLYTESTGTTSEMETYPIKPTVAKYMRINCHGHSQSANGWNSISEIVVTAVD